MVQRSTVRELKTEGRLEVAQQLFLNLARTQDLLMRDAATLLKAHGLSEPQYNVLRVLRAAGDPGLPCRVIGRRMLTRVPDVTRLVAELGGTRHHLLWLHMRGRADGAGPDRTPPVEKIMLDAGVLNLILESARRLDEWALVREKIQSDQ